MPRAYSKIDIGSSFRSYTLNVRRWQTTNHLVTRKAQTHLRNLDIEDVVQSKVSDTGLVTVGILSSQQYLIFDADEIETICLLPDEVSMGHFEEYKRWALDALAASIQRYQRRIDNDRSRYEHQGLSRELIASLTSSLQNRLERRIAIREKIEGIETLDQLAEAIAGDAKPMLVEVADVLPSITERIPSLATASVHLLPRESIWARYFADVDSETGAQLIGLVDKKGDTRFFVLLFEERQRDRVDAFIEDLCCVPEEPLGEKLASKLIHEGLHIGQKRMDVQGRERVLASAIREGYTVIQENRVFHEVFGRKRITLSPSYPDEVKLVEALIAYMKDGEPIRADIYDNGCFQATQEHLGDKLLYLAIMIEGMPRAIWQPFTEQVLGGEFDQYHKDVFVACFETTERIISKEVGDPKLQNRIRAKIYKKRGRGCYSLFRRFVHDNVNEETIKDKILDLLCH
jgi:hypothetical protein